MTHFYNDCHLSNCSLIIDDIQDEYELRRGEKCAHLVYGIPSPINASYFNIFEMLKNIKITINIQKK